MVALATCAVIPSERKGGPRDPYHQRIQASHKRAFEVTFFAMRVPAANSVFVRAMFLWPEELAKSDHTLSKAGKGTLKKKIALAAAFSANASLAVLLVSSRAVASSRVAKRNMCVTKNLGSRCWFSEQISRHTIC